MDALNTKESLLIKLKNFLWPFEGKQENKKFIGLAIMMIGVLLNYSLLRGMKDTLINTAKSGGAELIPTLKSLVVLPLAILFFIVYSKLSHWFSQEKVFYIIVGFFAVYFFLFFFILYPNIDFFHASDATINLWKEQFPRLRFMTPLIGLWGFTLFFVFAELWGSAVLSLLFWQFANEVCTTKEAKKIYPMIALFANLALILTGSVTNFFKSLGENSTEDTFLVMTRYTGSTILLIAVIILSVYYAMRKDPDCKKEEILVKKSKVKLGFFASIKYLATNSYLMLLSVMVLAYGISVNLIEVVWKKQLQLQFPLREDYMQFMGNFQIQSGVIGFIMVIFTKNLVRRFGWKFGALITPIAMAVSVVVFFIFILQKEVLDPTLMSWGYSSLWGAVYLGMYLLIVSKGLKYSQFDPTKEMAFIPLTEEERTKGKAAVDVIGGRLGKALGGYIVTSMFVVFSGATIESLTPVLGGIVIMIVVLWVLAVIALSKKYEVIADKS
jgi:AAA family ATP:ADP antiporter